MPLPYLAIHILAFLCAAVLSVLVTRKDVRLGKALSAGVVILGLALQITVVKYPRFYANLFEWTDLFFFSKFYVHIAAVATAVALASLKKPAVRLRAGVLSLVLLSLACFASRDIFLPPPSLREGVRLHPKLAAGDEPRVVRQSAESSCAPAAAATLLRAMRVDPDATEAKLAEVCYTHPWEGTSDLGLYRGLRLSAPGRLVRFRTRSLESLKGMSEPCIVFVSLSRERVADPKLFQFLEDKCNWREDESHAVVCFGFARDGQGEKAWDVAIIGDPTFGVERWSLEHFEVLWDGTTLEVDQVPATAPTRR